MYSIKIHIIYFVSFNIIVQIESLVQLPVVEDNSIAIAETVIRNTVNSLFATLNIQEIKKRPTIKQYSTIHNFFASITLTDCENHRKIARLSTVNNIDNNTKHFITQINEVLNEGDKSKEANVNDNNIYVTTYIERFIKKLRYLKEIYMSRNDSKINEKVLKLLEKSGKPFTNLTEYSIFNKTTKESGDKNVLDDIEVWQISGRRIFNGLRTNIKRFPFMASIHFFSRFQCAGSIIKNDLIITSSSCMQIAWNNRFFRENPSFLSVKVGSDMYQTGGDDIPVLEIYFHPQYDPETLAHNIALLRLGRLLKFRRRNRRVKKIDFDTNPVPLSMNTIITVVGWGAKDSTNKIFDIVKNKLAFANLDFYPLKECQEHYSDVYVTNRNFCAGFISRGGGACSHDAGGPGVVGSVLTGVISFGSPDCGGIDSPTVFTKLGFYTDWIESILRQNIIPRYKHTTTLATTRSTRWLEAMIASAKETTKLSFQPFDNNPGGGGENILRMAKDERFKDFISTMFSSEEVNVYLEKHKHSKENSPVLRLDDLQSGMTATIIADQGMVTIKPDTSSSIEELVQSPMYDSKVNFSEVGVAIKESSKSHDEPNTETTPKEEETTVTLTTEAPSSTKSFEKDIMDLIDNLDIENLVASSAVDKLDEFDDDQNNTEIPREEPVSIEKEVISVDLNENDDVDNPVSEKAALRFLLESNEENNNNNDVADDVNDDGDGDSGDDDNGDYEDDEDDDGGMSIPVEEFQDLTFRESSGSETDKKVVLSESALLDLISIAIKKEGFEKIKENIHL